MNNISNLVVLFDSTSDFDDLNETISQNKSKIISFDYDTHKILKDKKIEHEISDDYLSKEDLRSIQKNAYLISGWFNSDIISKYICYNGVNLGSLIQAELINILVNYIKKVFELYKISKHFKNSTFVSSHSCHEIMKNFVKNVMRFKNSNMKNFNQFPLDSTKVKIKIGTKKHSMEFGVSQNIFTKLKDISEKPANLMLSKNHSVDKNSKNILVVEFNTIRYRTFFDHMSKSNLNFVIYNRRSPAFWNNQSYNIVKQSSCVIETKNSLNNANLKKIILNGKDQIQVKILNLLSSENFFKSFFSFNEISFWSSFKLFFTDFLTKRALELIEEIELLKKLMEKYTFSSILILSEAGPHERIAIQLAEQKNIPVCLVQHGLNYDTKEGYDMNVAEGALPIKSDHYLCWGKVNEKYCKELSIKSEKIHVIGSPVFDNVIFYEQNFSTTDCVLLATAAPTKEDSSDLTIQIIEKYMDAIKKICQLVTKYDKKLIIKTHPSPDELDPSDIAKQISPEIKVIKEGNISPLIQSSDLMIVIDFTSPILDAHILKKPVISLSVKDKCWGIPTALKNNSCLVTDLEKLENDLKSVLYDEHIRNQLIKNGTKSSTEYLAYQNNGSSKLVGFLEELVN